MLPEPLIGLVLAFSFPQEGIQLADSASYLLRIGETPIGRSVQSTYRDSSGMAFRTERSLVRMNRGGSEVQIREEGLWIEDASGALVSVAVTRSGLGPGDWTDRVDAIPGGLRRERTRGSATIVDTLPCEPLVGPLRQESILAGQSDRFRIRTLDPSSMAPATFHVEILGDDTLRQERLVVACRLYSARDSARAAAGSAGALQWRDREGRIWRERDQDLDFTVERSEIAGDVEIESDFDALAWRRIPLDGVPPRDPPCTLLLRPALSGLPAGVREGVSPVPSDSHQRVDKGPEPGSWVITTHGRATPETTERSREAWRRDPELAAALSSDLIVDAANPLVVAFAEEALAPRRSAGGSRRGGQIGETTGSPRHDPPLSPTEEANLLERAVHERIAVRDMGTVFATASQTLREGRGDCTEHAVLLAACCRARGIPARLVAGLVPMSDRMLFHLWTEVYLDEWFPLDATLGEGRAHPCAVALLRWTQMENKEDAFTLAFERIAGRYAVRIGGAAE